MMGIYLLTAKDNAPGPQYEVNTAMVVIAKSNHEARRLAAQGTIDEPEVVWTIASYSWCTRIGDCIGAQEPHILMRENNAS